MIHWSSMATTAPKARRNRELLERLAAGDPVSAVADTFGISRQRVHQIKRKAESRGMVRPFNTGREATT